MRVVQKRTTRILHVVNELDRCGMETWLMHVLRNIDRDRFEMDFLVHSEQPGAYDEEVCRLGSSVIPCYSPSRPWVYARNFHRMMRESGPYDIVHCHLHHFSGFVLWLAKREGIQTRIAHSHVDTSRLRRTSSFPRLLYQRLMETAIAREATVGLAASSDAAAALYGSEWENDSRFSVLHCGIDLSPYQPDVPQPKVRIELGLPKDAFVVGHVGRFVEQKNHRFLVEIAHEAIKGDDNTYFLLVGDGPLREEVERQVSELGISERVIFTRSRPDVPSLMVNAMDVLMLPSVYEGLPLVGMEAQAAGLPCLFSHAITPEVEIVPELVYFLGLSNPSPWVETITKIRRSGLNITRDKAYDRIKASQFNIENGIGRLENIYSSVI